MIARRQLWTASALFVVGLLLDQFLKYSVPTIFLNRAVSFGLSQSFGWFFYILALGVIVVILSNLSPITYYLSALVLAGGISNLLDRLIFGGVRDMWQISSLYFNLADLWVVGGAVGLIYLAFESQRIGTGPRPH